MGAGEEIGCARGKGYVLSLLKPLSAGDCLSTHDLV